jgi:hypothetical protein
MGRLYREHYLGPWGFERLWAAGDPTRGLRVPLEGTLYPADSVGSANSSMDV